MIELVDPELKDLESIAPVVAKANLTSVTLHVGLYVAQEGLS